MKVKCIFRFNDGAEPCLGYFDLTTRKIIGFEKYCNVFPDVLVYEYTDYAASKYSFETGKLYNLMFAYKDVRICLDYHGVGVIFIDKDTARLHNLIKGIKPDTTKFSTPLLKIESKNVGNIKAPIFTWEVAQPLMKFSVFEEDNKVKALTRFGLCNVECNNIDDLSMNPEYKLRDINAIPELGEGIIPYSLVDLKGEKAAAYIIPKDKQIIFSKV